MEKPADNEYPIHNLLRRRWSPRASSERPVEPAIWRSLFEARDGREQEVGLHCACPGTLDRPPYV
jgi:hypothetical protein